MRETKGRNNKTYDMILSYLLQLLHTLLASIPENLLEVPPSCRPQLATRCGVHVPLPSDNFFDLWDAGGYHGLRALLAHFPAQ